MERSHFTLFVLVTLAYKNLSAQDFVTSAILGLNDGNWSFIHYITKFCPRSVIKHQNFFHLIKKVCCHTHFYFTKENQITFNVTDYRKGKNNTGTQHPIFYCVFPRT